MSGLAILDLDGTLVDRDAGFAVWADRFCAAHGLGPARRRWVGELDARHRERGPFFAELVATLGLDDQPSSLWAAYRAVMPTLTASFPGVREALAALRTAGWTLAVLSNGQRDTQHGKLESAGLLGYFAVCRFSGESGLRKPDPAAYRELLAVVGTEASAAVWMVGDDPDLDVVGARSLGLSTMWITHGRPWPAHLVPPTGWRETPAEALRALTVP